MSDLIALLDPQRTRDPIDLTPPLTRDQNVIQPPPMPPVQPMPVPPIPPANTPSTLWSDPFDPTRSQPPGTGYARPPDTSMPVRTPGQGDTDIRPGWTTQAPLQPPNFGDFPGQPFRTYPPPDLSRIGDPPGWVDPQTGRRVTWGSQPPNLQPVQPAALSNPLPSRDGTLPPTGLDRAGRNNPGNIRIPGSTQFQVFPTQQAGLDAIGDLLTRYQDVYHLNTISSMINRYAPPIENNTAGYIQTVAAKLGVGPNDPIDMHDPKTRQAMTEAIVGVEQGTGGSRRGGIAQQTIPAAQIPSLANRSPDQWGRTPQGGYGTGPGNMPSTIPDVLKLVLGGGAIAGLLSGRSSLAQAAMFNTIGRMAEGYQNGQIAQTKLAADQFKLQLEQHNQQLTEENQEIGAAMAADPNDTQALYDIANKYGDRVLATAIQHGPDAVTKLMQARDRYNTNINKSDLAIQKMQWEQQKFEAEQSLAYLRLQTQTDETRQRIAIEQQRADQANQKIKALEEGGAAGYGGEPVPTAPPTPGAPSTTTAPAPPAPGSPTPPAPGSTPGPTAAPTTTAGPDYTNAPAAAPPQPAPTPGAQPTPAPAQTAGPGAPSGTPQQPPTPAPTPATPPPTPSSTGTVQQPPAATPTAPNEPRFMAVGRALFEGQDLKADQYDPDTWARGVGYRDQLNSRLNAIVANPNIKGQDVINAVSQLDPGYADLVNQIAHNRQDITQLGGRGQSGAEWRTGISALALRVNPNWNSNQHGLQTKFMTGNSPEQTTIQRLAPMSNAGQRLLRDLADVPFDPKHPDAFSQTLQAIVHGLKGDPVYTTLANDWLAYQQDVNVVTTGKGLEGETVLNFNNIPWYSTPEKFRLAIMHDAEGALARVRSLREQWASYGGEGDPIYDHQAVEELNDLATKAQIPGHKTSADIDKALGQ